MMARPKRSWRRVAVALTFVVSMGAAVLLLHHYFAAELDGFESPLSVMTWSCEVGSEYPGAAASLARSQTAARKGRYGLELRYDFRGGGRYVQAARSLRYRRSVCGIRMWVRGSQDSLLALRVRDSRGQVFQRTVGRAGTVWSELSLRFAGWTESWGGPGDGVPRWPASAVAIVVINSGLAPSGRVFIDEVRLGRTSLADPPAKRVTAPHPRLLIAAKDIPSLRARVRSDPRATRICAELAKAVARGKVGHLVLPARGGQCKHWYACPVHGCALTTDGHSRHRCPVDGRTFTGWPYDDVVVAYEHDRLARLARDAGVLWVATSDPNGLQTARRILLTYAGSYRTYGLHDIHGSPTGGARVHAQSLDEAVWLVTMAQAADLVWRDLSPAERTRLRDGLFLPAIEDVVRPSRMTIHNIQCWHNAAIGLVGYLIGDTDLIYEAVDGPVGLREQLRRGLTSDGMWNEGSWGYHFYALRAMVALAEAATNSGDVLYGQGLRSMLLLPIKAAMPDGSLPALNDSGRIELAKQEVYEAGYARYRDPVLAGPLRGSARDSVASLLSGTWSLPGALPTRRPSRALRGSGLAILQGGRGSHATWVCVKYGAHGGGHGHFDQNGLTAYAEGHVVFDDPGIGPHLSPLADGWYKTTVAHNTIAVDERNQSAAVGSLVAFESGPEWAACITDAGDAVDGVRFRRATFLLDDRLLVVLDLLSAQDGRAHVYDAFWHLGGRLGPMPLGASVRPADAPGYRHILGLRRRAAKNALMHVPIETQRGRRWLVLGSVPSRGTALLTGSGPPGATRSAAPVVVARRRARDAVFVAATSLGPLPAPPTIRPLVAAGAATLGGTVVEARAGAHAWMLVANPDNVVLTVRGRTDRRSLVVTQIRR